MIDGKRGGEWCSIQSVQRRRGTGGRDKGKGRGCAPWGDIGGGDRSKSGRQAGRHDEAKRFGVSEWYGCSSSRVRIYIAAIYSIFIYIYYLYIYNINIISIYLIIYINIISFSTFLCNTSVLYVKNNIYIYCKLLYINVLRVFPSLSLYLCRLWELNTPPPRTPTTPTTPTLSLNFLFFLFFGGVTRSSPSLFIIFIIISTILQKSFICPFICVLPHFYFLFV